MNINILKQLLNDQYFTQGTVTINPRSVAFSKGHANDQQGISYTIKGDKVLVPVKPKELSDYGLGQLGVAENYWLYTLTALNFPNGTALKKGDIVVYKNKNFQIVQQLDFETHGFYGQLITSSLVGVNE